ncbi:MAG TPA: hypothetical protein VFO25_11015 [Candidatus Eremiobacteraceae bacterium]|nr:hypothetical protein [Candidatus Eremiobacteraceae bacterium]
MRTAGIVIVAACAAFASACSSSTLAEHTAAPNRNVVPALTGVKIYAADESANAIFAYKLTATGDVKPSTKLKGRNTGLAAPIGVDNDGSGQLYVLEQSSFEVFAAGARGNVAPEFVVSGALTQLDNAQGIAVDPSGITYVTNSTGGNSYITVYAAGSNGNRGAIATIFDGQNFFFVPAGIALFNGTLYVADPGDQSLNEYPANSNGTVNPTAEITGLNSPRGVAVDTKGRIYVTDGNNVIVYAANANGNATPLATISGSATLLDGPGGLSVHGTVIAVANSANASITVYPKNGTGDIAPLRAISGSLTGLVDPQDIDIH